MASPKQSVIFFLFTEPHLVVVLTGVGVIEVSQLREILDSLMGHLQNGQANGHIVGSLQIIATFILKVFLLDITEQSCIESSKVTSHKRISSIIIILDGNCWKRTGVTNFAINSQKVRVDEPSIIFLESCRKQLEDLPAQQLIISIDYQKYILGLTVLFGSHSEVRHGPLLLLIPDDQILFCRYLMLLLQHFLDIISSAVSAGIINEDNMIVGVLLHQNGLHILQMSAFLVVIVAGNHYAKRDLSILTYIVLLFIIISLGISYIVGFINILACLAH